MMQQIIKNEEKILAAIANNDVETLDELIHEDLLFNIPNGQTITKLMDLEFHRTRSMKIDKLEASEREINLIGDTAIAVVTVEIKGSYMNQPIEQKIRFLRVWKYFDNQWRVIAGSSTNISFN